MAKWEAFQAASVLVPVPEWVPVGAVASIDTGDSPSVFRLAFGWFKAI